MKALTSRQRGVRRVQVELDVEAYDALSVAAGMSGKKKSVVLLEVIEAWLQKEYDASINFRAALLRRAYDRGVAKANDFPLDLLNRSV